MSGLLLASHVLHFCGFAVIELLEVNFIVVLDGLTNQLLGVIVRCEDKRLEEDKNQLLFQVAKGRLADLSKPRHFLFSPNKERGSRP